MSKANFICALDLETIANPAMLSLLPEVKPSGTLKDPDKIKKDIESRMGKQISGMGLNPHTNTICCASFQDVYTGESVTFGIDTLDGEKELLVKVWDYVKDFQMFTTFNGISFDIECLKFHSMLYKIKPSVVISQQKYKTGNHVDLRMVLSRNNEFAKGTQDYFCKLILGEGKNDIDGSMIQGLWDDGRIGLIREYCENDVDMISKLYKRLEGYYI